MSDCWTTRSEGDSRYDNHGDQWAPEDCGHAVCSADADTWTDCLIRRMDDLCVLEKGHTEPHEFDGATIEFPVLSRG